jgi:zinc protease
MRFTRSRVLSALLFAASLAACQSQAPTSRSREPAADQPAAASSSATPATVAERLVDEPTRRVLRLTNGFTIILQQNKTAPVVAARIYIKAGALTEGQYMGAGISHVLEHLVAGATSGKRAEAENTLLLQQIGNDSNAYTDADQTCYFITTSSDKWPVAMDLLVDWTTNTNFTREQFEREYKVVQRELEMGEAEADRTFYLRTQATRYLQSPARHPVIGYKAAFQKLTFEDCKAYFAQMYVPDNMVLSLAGDLELDKAEELIIGQLKGIRRKTVPAIALPQEPPVTVPRRSVSRADVRETRVEWAFPTMDMYNPDLYATDVLATVLGGGESSLLVRTLRDERSLVTGIDASHPTPSYVQGQLTVTATLKADRLPEAQAAALDLLRKVQQDGVPADAVDRAKATAAASLVYGNQTAEQQAIRNALDYLATGNIDFTEQYVARIQAVTPEEVQAAARKYLRPESLLTTVVLPLDAPDPFAATAATQPGGGGRGVTRAAVATQRTVLKNGVTVLITRNPAAPIVSFHLYTLGGLLAETDASNGIGTAMMEMLPRGTASRSHAQIADFLDGTGTTLSTESGNNSFAISVQSLKARGADAFDLFADIALHPKFAPDELDQLRPQLLSAVEAQSEDWFSEGYKNIREAYFADSPYKRLPAGSADVISKLTSADLQKHYQAHFHNPKKTVLAISGDIDPAVAAAWAARFESIPPSDSTVQDHSTPAAARTLTRTTAKESAAVMFAFPPGMTASDPDRYAMTVLQTYLGGYSSPGGSLLHETLRGQGLVYNVQAMNFAGAAGGMFLIYTLGEPDNVPKILTSVGKIIANVRAGQIPDTALNAAKEQAITGEKLSKQTIAEKAQSEALDELLGLGYDEDDRFPDRIRAVTNADVIRVANKYLNTPTIVITAPEKKP